MFPAAAPIATPVALGLSALGIARDAYNGYKGTQNEAAAPSAQTAPPAAQPNQANPVQPVSTLVSSATGPDKPQQPVPDSTYAGSGASFEEAAPPEQTTIPAAQPAAQEQVTLPSAVPAAPQESVQSQEQSAAAQPEAIPAMQQPGQSAPAQTPQTPPAMSAQDKMNQAAGIDPASRPASFSGMTPPGEPVELDAAAPQTQSQPSAQQPAAQKAYTPSHYERGAQVLSQGIRNGTITPAQAQAAIARMPEAERNRAKMIMSGGSPQDVNKYLSQKTGEAHKFMSKQRNYKIAGFVDMLRKEGANEDFILGFLKEADVNANDLPEDRHRILPFMNNQMTGALGGAMLGNLVSNEMDLDGVPGMILPMLGAYAGYSHLPSLMNNLKDPAGIGANATHPAVTNFVNARNYGPSPGSPNFVGPVQPEPIEAPTNPQPQPVKAHVP